MTSMIFFCGLSSWLWTYFIPCHSTFIVDFEHVMSADRVHSQPGNEGIVREFKSSPFFTEKSGNDQGVLIECQGNKGGIS